jgi:hypothetical protein
MDAPMLGFFLNDPILEIQTEATSHPTNQLCMDDTRKLWQENFWPAMTSNTSKQSLASLHRAGR